MPTRNRCHRLNRQARTFHEVAPAESWLLVEGSFSLRQFLDSFDQLSSYISHHHTNTYTTTPQPQPTAPKLSRSLIPGFFFMMLNTFPIKQPNRLLLLPQVDDATDAVARLHVVKGLCSKVGQYNIVTEASSRPVFGHSPG